MNKIVRHKKMIPDPIKTLGLDGNNGAREIVIQIATALKFKIHEDKLGVSAYGGNAIRIADHCTYMQTWVDNGTWNAPMRLDIVIEDEPTTAKTQVSVGYDFTITEFVHSSSNIDPEKARIIAYDIRNSISGQPYANNARGDRKNLVATHGDNNNQELKTEQYMNKKITLTESDLHRIVKESVQRILREGKVVNNKPLKYIYNPCATFKQEREIQPDQRAVDLGGMSYNADGNFAYYYDKNGDKVYVNNDEVYKHEDRYVKSLFAKMGVTDDEWWGMTERERELLAMRKLNPHEKFELYKRHLYDLPHYYDENCNKVYVTKNN